MRPQDIVAIILAIGVVFVLIFGTGVIKHFTGEYDDPMPLENLQLQATFWKDIVNVILGALAGYIAGRVHE